MPAPHANDYWAFVTLGPLRFLARMPKLVEKALRTRNIALSKLVIHLSAGEWETLKRREDQRRWHWRWLRDEIGAVIGERIRWRWRTLRNSETGAIRHERGPLAVQHEWGAVRIEIGRLWFVRCAPKHPNRWMIIWKVSESENPAWLGNPNNPTPWVITRKGRAS
jgi:hypothetical protein